MRHGREESDPALVGVTARKGILCTPDKNGVGTHAASGDGARRNGLS
jgi:hypothetical protein